MGSYQDYPSFKTNQKVPIDVDYPSTLFVDFQNFLYDKGLKGSVLNKN